MMRKFLVLGLGMLLASAVEAGAQDEDKVLVYYEPHTGFWDVFDIDDPGIYAKPRVAPHDVVTSKTRAGVINWNVTYQDIIDNNDFGWDDPTFGAARRATFLEVLDYVASVLNESPATPIDVHWTTSVNAPMVGTLARMGSFHFLSNGYSSGLAQEHITTGVDPTDQVVDISGEVNFGRVWNSETDDPGGSEFDLFSVLLHEITHGLGVASILQANGTSGITNTNPGKFSFIDRFMELDTDGAIGTGASTDLFNDSAQYIGSVANLVSGRLVYTGTNTVAEFGSNPQIFAPDPFQSASSLSHWDSSTGEPVMLPTISQGAKKRAYLPFEVANLIDIGYLDAAPVVDSADVFVDFTAVSNGDGASSSPFDNLADAVSAVAVAGTIHIEPGSSAELFFDATAIGKALTLVNEDPAGGAVIVGEP